MYAIIDKNGQWIGTQDNLHDAVLQARRHGPVVVQESAPEENPSSRLLELAVEKSTLAPIDLAEVDELSFEHAHSILWEVFQRNKMSAGQYGTLTDMLSNFIDDNGKMEKTIEGVPAFAEGLSLMPYGSFWGADHSAGDAKRLPTLCLGSNQLCREMCLVGTGQNNASTAVRAKRVKTEALFEHPAAFTKILRAAIQRRSNAAEKAGKSFFCRLNVFSDIPWEEIAPWIFATTRGVRFYDYTKVAGRRPPSNYHLTFSYSGTNKASCVAELERGRSVAVVFLLGRRDKKHQKKFVPLPSRFWGTPVISGDKTDFRPLDEIEYGPGPYIVGLYWKAPKGAAKMTPEQSAFVIPVHIDPETGAGVVSMVQHPEVP